MAGLHTVYGNFVRFLWTDCIRLTVDKTRPLWISLWMDCILFRALCAFYGRIAYSSTAATKSLWIDCILSTVGDRLLESLWTDCILFEDVKSLWQQLMTWRHRL